MTDEREYHSDLNVEETQAGIWKRTINPTKKSTGNQSYYNYLWCLCWWMYIHCICLSILVCLSVCISVRSVHLLAHLSFSDQNFSVAVIIVDWLSDSGSPSKELGPRTAKLALSFCLKKKMVKYVWKSTNSTNGSLLIRFHVCSYDVTFQTGSWIMTS